MKIPHFLTLLLFLVATNSAQAIDAYIVAGQSNGWRISHLKQGTVPQPESAGPKIHYFGMDCVAEPESSKLVTLTAVDPGSMGFGLAKALTERTGKDIVFIQYCRCGASVLAPEVNSWFPGDDPLDAKIFEQGLCTKFEKYLAAAKSQVKQTLHADLEIKGLIWHQGESDINSDKAQFERAVKNVFLRLRCAVGPNVPIVAGHIRDLGDGPRGINATLNKIAADDGNILTVPLDGLEFEPDRNGKPDVHIARSGCHELGRRMVLGLDVLDLQAAVTAAGGKVELASNPPRVIGIDLYNGNNPLKGKGGRNEAVTDEWLAKHLPHCSSLKKLGLANCQITNDGLQHVGKLTGLEELNLTLTSISDDGLRHLGDLTHLRNLGLASSQCTGTGFSHLGKLKHLENVNFHFTPLNDAGLQAICAVGVSGRLWFAHVKFTDEGAKSLQQLKVLKRCGMGSNVPQSSGEAVASLAHLPLEDLSLLDNQANPVGIAHAAKIQTLKRLDVSYAPTANNSALAMVAALPHIEEFHVGSAPDITDAGIAAFAGTKSLKKLVLHQLKNVTEQGIAELEKARPDLVVEVK